MATPAVDGAAIVAYEKPDDVIVQTESLTSYDQIIHVSSVAELTAAIQTLRRVHLEHNPDQEVGVPPLMCFTGWSPNPRVDRPDDPVISMAVGETIFRARLCLVLTWVITNDPDYADRPQQTLFGYWCGSGNLMYFRILITQLDAAGVDYETRFPGIQGRMRHRVNLVGGNTAVTPRGIAILAGEDKEVYAFLQSNAVTMEIGAMTVMYHLYPHVRPWFIEHVTIMDWNDSTTAYPGIVPHGPGELSPGNQDLLLQGYALYLFSPSWTNPREIGAQMAKRIGTAVQQSGVTFANPVSYSALTTHFNFTHEEKTSILSAAMGALVARDEDGAHNVRIKKADKWDHDEALDAAGVQIWARTLYEQCCMLYEKTHSTTLGFAISGFPLARPYCESINEDWEAETEVMTRLCEDVRERPYIGLVASLPIDQRIVSYARYALVGYYIQLNNQPDEESRTKMLRYQHAGIAAHISSAADRDLPRAIAEVIPKHNVTGMAAMLRHLTKHRARAIMDGRPELFQKAVYQHIQDTWPADRGEWYQHFRDDMQSKEANRIHTAVQAGFRAALEDQVAAYTARILNIPDFATQQRAHAALAAWKLSKLQALAPESPVKLLVTTPGSHIAEDFYNQRVEELERLYESISTDPAPWE